MQTTTEDDKERFLAGKILAAKSFPQLRAATRRHLRSLYKLRPDPEIDREMDSDDKEPWRYLTAHAGVWNAKSQRAKTLLRLAKAVIAEAEIPTYSGGKFRHDATRVDWSKVVVA